ncbi:unnamed protein product [Didymodactylos carnosus]|uniref:Uncharacterized protein n=1 Tax=Didymodactylos carnosus TaxID=1234261 RepID=A0A8S2G765_9BILA|nr:unnamed protein product [Didymodactylos carnosus]CAF4488502.1 unnamed protein product [Didymodactylos carnosus]
MFTCLVKIIHCAFSSVEGEGMVADKLLKARKLSNSITFYDLCKDLKNSMSVSNVIQSLYLLLKYGLVIVAGNVTRLFINRKFARSWLICSIRFQDNIFDKMDLDKTSLETYLTTTVAETSVDVCDINEIKNLHTTTTSNKLATDQFQVNC